MISMSEMTSVHAGLEALADGFFMLDAEWRVSYWNGAAERFLQVPREGAPGRVLWELLPALKRSELGRHLRRVMATRQPVESLVPHLPDCCEGYYSVRAAPLEDGGLAVHFRDATDETKLADRYSQLLEAIRDGFIAVDHDGSIVYINHVAERLLRLPRDRALGMQIWALVPRRPEEIEKSLRATLKDALPRRLRRVRPEGNVFRNHFFDLSIHPLPGGGISVLFQDVTRRVQREKDLSRYAAEAEEANLAKSRFFAAVSHELRTPLNAIVGYTHLLSTDTYGDLPSPAVRAASRASLCAEHLAQLIDDLLLMTTGEIDQLPVSPTPLSLQESLPAVLEPMRQQAEAKRLKFRLELAPDLPAIETDPGRLRQLLHTVLSNAIKFTSRGTVSIHAFGLADPASAGQNQANPPSAPVAALDVVDGVGIPHGVRIRISDTGPGIPPEARERVFEAFEQLGDPSRTDSLQRGPGLGLTVARRLARLLQGSLSLESTSERGSVFCIDLPLRMNGGGEVGIENGPNDE
jgi:PAS domain S-box-containing protein